MGAHSLGRARRRNSGFNGLWTPGRTNRFDNEFYQLLVAPDIVYRNTVSSLVIGYKLGKVPYNVTNPTKDEVVMKQKNK